MSQLPPEGQLARWDGTGWVPVGTPVAPRKPFCTRWWVWVPVVIVLVALAGRTVGAGSEASVAASSVGPTATAVAPAEPTASQEPTEATPSATPSPSVTRAKPAPKPSYAKLTGRQFKLMAKDPDSYIGKHYVVYGEITQFDAATGTDAFRADTGPKKLRISYGFVDYDQNTILTGSEARLRKLVEGDCFTAKVTVLGSFSYDTQIGGNTTVPSLQVDSISVYGSTD